MTTESRKRVRPRPLLVVIAASGCLLVACGKSTSQSSAAVQAASPKAAESSQPFTVGSIFPPGEGRELVLNTCGSCHPVVCAARGQRTPERWDNLQKDHKDKLTNTTSAQLNVMFAYLKENFNDKKPEPQVPAEVVQQGCTPF